jgi:carboxylesterase type B
MAAYWSAMAAMGNPNAAGQVAWPAYDSVQDSYLELSATPAAKAGLRKAECDLWDQVIG